MNSIERETEIERLKHALLEIALDKHEPVTVIERKKKTVLNRNQKKKKRQSTKLMIDTYL